MQIREFESNETKYQQHLQLQHETVQQLQSMIALKDDAIASLEKDMHSHTETLNRHKAQQQELKSKVDKLNLTIILNEGEIKTLKQKNITLQETTSELSQTIQQLTEELNSTKESKLTLAREMDDALYQISQHENTITKLNEKIMMGTVKVCHYNHIHDNLYVVMIRCALIILKVANLESKCTDADEKIADLTRDLNLASAQVEGAYEDLDVWSSSSDGKLLIIKTKLTVTYTVEGKHRIIQLEETMSRLSKSEDTVSYLNEVQSLSKDGMPS
jgi:predicted  nucleic acid-binding Zn-ribbon protein